MHSNGSDGVIKVLFYSGYREGETPRSLIAGGREFPVEKVLSRRRGLDVKTGRSFDIFRVRVAGSAVVIRRDESGAVEILRSSDLSFLASRPG